MADTLESLEIQVKHSASGAADEIKRVSSAISGLSRALSNVLPKLNAFREALGKSPVNISNNSTTQIADTINNVNNAAGKAKGATREAAKGIKEMSKAASKAKNPLETFISSLKRIAMYRILRSIIKAITQAFQEGLQNAYAFSNGIEGEGHRFAEAMDSMKTATSTMKNQLGSAFISLLTAIAPIINTIISLITKLADALSQLFAAFTGSTYLKAADVPQKWAEAAGGAGKAAKEWKNQLLGFDEINRLNEPNQGGGGGGGGGVDPSQMFKESPINEKLLAFINRIKEGLQPALERCKEAFERLKEAWERFTDSITQDGALSNLISDLLILCGTTILNGITVLADVLTLVLDVLTALNTGDWSQVWRSFAQLLYDIVILIADFFVGLTNLIVDALLVFTGIIDDLLGTDLSGWLKADNEAFNEMYNAAKNSDEGLFGLKKTLGLTETATEKAADGAEDFSDALLDVGDKSQETDGRVREVRGAVEWVLDGFRGFGGEVAAIITSLFQPLADLCAWIDSALQGFSILGNVSARASRDIEVGNIYAVDPSMLRADGGFVDEGQLFIAREAGAEMVGSIGGHTAVANNDQIVEAIRAGVFDGVLAANNNSGNRDVNVKVYLDSREIRTGQTRIARAMGVG